MADDFHYIRILDDGLVSGFTGHFEAMGVWRWWGSIIVSILLNLHPYAFPAAAFLTHIGAVWFFYSVCRRVIGSHSVALGAALVVAAMPIGYEAILWASAYHYVLATLLFWLMLNVLLKSGDPPGGGWLAFFTVFGLTLAGALVHEALVVCALLSPVYLWWPEHTNRSQTAASTPRMRYAGLGAATGAILYVGLYFATLSTMTTKQPGVFNAPTILAVYYHQIFQSNVFLAWKSQTIVEAAFSSWRPWWTAVATTIAGCLIAAAWSCFRRSENPQAGGFDVRRATVLFASLLLGASLVYAVHGGFSRDSRKQYPLLYLVVLVVCYAWEHWLPRRWKRSALCVAALPAILAAEVTTAWLMTGLWQWEARRSDALVQLMIDRNSGGEVRIESRPDIYESWSFMHESFGFRFTDEGILNQALARRPPLPRPVRVTRNSDAPLFFYDGATGAWKYSESGHNGR